MNTSKRFLTHFCLAVVMLMLVHLAQAVPINGSANFTGSGSGNQSSGVSTLTFNHPMTFTFGLGDFDGIPSGTSTVFAPISWTGSGMSATLTTPNNLEWMIVSGGTTYEFTLSGLSNATLDATHVFLDGTGVLTISGALTRDPTLGRIVLEGTGSGFNYTITVPEPHTVGLLLCGISVLLLGARRAQRI